MAHVRKRASAKLDLVDHFVYLAENANLDTAERFLSCAESSFNDLATYPDLGPQLSVRSRELAAIRKWRVKDFENFLIFYQADADGVTIVRVLHASRDWWTLLGLL
jgi:toxin ParE1/3/4